MHSLYVGGIDHVMLREIVFMLSSDSELVRACIGSFYLLQKCVDIVTRQMEIIHDEIEYWRSFLLSTPIQKVSINLFRTGPSNFVRLAKEYLTGNISTSSNNIELTGDLRLAILRETFSNLASLLGSLHNCTSELRMIFTEFENITLLKRLNSSLTAEISYLNYELSYDDYKIFIESSRSRVMYCLEFIYQSFEGLKYELNQQISSQKNNLSLSETYLKVTNVITSVEVYFI